MRRLPLALFACCVLALIWLVVDPRGWRHTLRLKEDLQRLEEQNRMQREVNERLKQELQLLADDPRALERAAREELGLIKPGEVIYLLEEGDGSTER